MACFFNHPNDTTIKIPRNIDINGITFYDIHITIGSISWTVQHRYKEFVELHEKLVSGQSIARDLLPPKKVYFICYYALQFIQPHCTISIIPLLNIIAQSQIICVHSLTIFIFFFLQVIGNRCPTFLENRQANLEKYLQKVLIFLQFTMCREFVEFCAFNQYDIIYILQDMAEKFYNRDHSTHHEFSALELHAITERLKLPCPALTNGIQNVYDFSHVLDYCSQLDAVTVRPHQQKQQKKLADEQPLTDDPNQAIGTSNIVPSHLKFDMNAFRNLRKLTIVSVSTETICDADWLRSSLVHLAVHHTAVTQLNQILLCDCVHRTVAFDTVLDESKLWQRLEVADFSMNAIDGIDSTMMLLPRLRKLSLSSNHIAMLSNVDCLPYLSALSLSDNRLTECVDCHLQLGNLISLDLGQNQLKSLNGFRKMYSLVRLDVSCNAIDEVDEVDSIAKLPCLEELILTGNPVATTVGKLVWCFGFIVVWGQYNDQSTLVFRLSSTCFVSIR